MNRPSEIIATGPASIKTYIDGEGDGLDVVVLPSYGRDGGEDFDAFSAALAKAAYRVLRPQPRGTARPGTRCWIPAPPLASSMPPKGPEAQSPATQGCAAPPHQGRKRQ